jgi:hypothetical protein
LALYHLEAVIKIMGLGISKYLRLSWNRFDLALLILNDLFQILTSYNDLGSSSLDSIPTVLRALRLGKVVQYVKLDLNEFTRFDYFLL